MRRVVLTSCLVSFCMVTVTYCQFVGGNIFKDENAIVDPQILQEKWALIESSLTGLVQDSVKMLMPRAIEASMSLNISSVCVRDVLKVIQGLKKMKSWAFKFVDASSKFIDGMLDFSTTSLGDYDECVNNEVLEERPVKDKGKLLFRGKYCRIYSGLYLPDRPQNANPYEMLDALKNFTNKDTVIGFLARHAHMFYYGSLNFAVCIPSSCSENDVHQVLKKVSDSAGIYIRKPSCQVKEEPKFTPDVVFIITLYSFTGLLVLIGTGVEIYALYWKTTIKSRGFRVFTSFSFVTNFRKLIDTSVSSDAFTCFHGMKALSIIWIIYGHSYIGLLILRHKIPKVLDIAKDYAYQPIINGQMGVETFFFMSGVLVCYQFTKMFETGKKPFSFVMYILHRILRIFPPYSYVIAFLILLPLLGSGPEFANMASFQSEECKKNWWANLLFINNFYESRHMCFPTGWYLTVDMQLYVGAVIILLPLMKWPRIGTMIAVIAILASMVGSWLSLYVRDLKPFYGFSLDVNGILDSFVYLYVMPHTHVGPYCVGILCGYFLAKHQKIEIPKAVQIVGWCASTVTCLSILYGVQKWYAGAEPTFLETLFHTSCSRTAWSLSMAWITICCKTGHGGLANYILSWKVWIPLGRLSLLAYLIHPIIICLYLATVRIVLPVDHHTGVWLFLGHTVLTYLFSVGANLLVEGPFISLEKVMLRRERSEDAIILKNPVRNDLIVPAQSHVLSDVKDPEACATTDKCVISCKM